MRAFFTSETRKALRFHLNLLVVFLVLIEAAAQFFMSAPARIPSGKLLTAMRRIYWSEREKNLIQYSQDCAQHSDLLGYTLRPGACTFSGPEFRNKFVINSLGLRDDEQSLKAPEIIVLGDSHAMGWGVEQEETFAQIIEARTGSTVLNAAVSSYGTAREMMDLRRLDTSRLRVLVIQYSNNDLFENQAFYDGNNHLNTMGLAQYSDISNAQERIDNYYFGKHLKHIWSVGSELARKKIPSLGLGASEAQAMDISPRLNEAQLFLNALTHSGLDLRGVEIIVFEISNYGRRGHAFTDLLQISLSYLDHFRSFFSINAIDFDKLLGAQHYYRLDGHLNVEGHRVVAETILGTMDDLPKTKSSRPGQRSI